MASKAERFWPRVSERERRRPAEPPAAVPRHDVGDHHAADHAAELKLVERRTRWRAQRNIPPRPSKAAATKRLIDAITRQEDELRAFMRPNRRRFPLVNEAVLARWAGR
jgi:hypothetical protein